MDIREQIQNGEFDALEAFLLERMASCGCDALEICRATRASDVRMAWWGEMQDSLARLADAGKPITALKLNISSYIDPPPGMPMNPAVEASVLDDSKVAFSTTSVAELLALSEDYPAPWTGGGGPYFSETYDTDGLGALTGYVMEAQHPDDIWANYFLIMRYHQKIHALCRGEGLPLPMKVLVGGHGISPWLVSVVGDARVARSAPEHISAVARASEDGPSFLRRVPVGLFGRRGR